MSTDRRADPRMELTLPVRVQGHDPNGKPWEEMTTTDDASFGGASFALKHPLEVHQALLLSLPLPKSFRHYDLAEQSYRVYALVRDVTGGKAGVRVGVLFLGKNPPKGYEKNPGGRYLLPSDPPPASKERRQFERLENAFVNLKLTRVNGDGNPQQEERTVAENVGKGGARVMTTLSVTKGEVLIVEEMGGPFRTRAEICNVYVGEDRIPRLNLHFLDTQAPDRLVAGR
jgi:PilZ domain-containing protein